jgi:tripartite-type tricarboxylate transporter receptor subunit TctC
MPLLPLLMGVLLSLASGTYALAQSADVKDFPESPIRMVVSVAAGGANDIVARIVSEKLLAKWGKPVVVENRVGAGSNIAAELVSRANPDGYTLLVSPPAPLVVNAALYKQLRYDPTALAPISIAIVTPNVLVVGGKSRFKTAEEFLTFARSNPEQLSFASQGNGTTGHLTGALMEQILGVKQIHVPYNGAAPALNDLVAGHVNFMFADVGTVASLAQGGELRMLAVLAEKRIDLDANIPTMSELGMGNFLSDTWTGFSAPPGTPLSIRQKISDAIKEIVFSDEVKARLQKLGITPLGLSPDQSAKVIAKETVRWTDVVKRAGVTLD